ncbi:hypothetical protein ACH5RR_006811 [Cinchona calisaya]|uniref:Uncharacterized protein n=1 Tax=Cinchona calisaya TaxID=153742 RepID=A0ABD3AQ52_9GENT
MEHCLDKSIQALADNYLHVIISNLNCSVSILRDFQHFTFVQNNLDNFVILVNFFYEFRISSKVNFKIFKFCPSQVKFCYGEITCLILFYLDMPPKFLFLT